MRLRGCGARTVASGDEFCGGADGLVGDLDEVGGGLDVVDDAADAVGEFLHVGVGLLDLGGGGVERGRVGLEVAAVEGGEDVLGFFCAVAEEGAVGGVVAGEVFARGGDLIVEGLVFGAGDLLLGWVGQGCGVRREVNACRCWDQGGSGSEGGTSGSGNRRWLEQEWRRLQQERRLPRRGLVEWRQLEQEWRRL